MAFAGMPQDHARTVLANARAAVGVEGVRGARPEHGAGDRAGPGGLAASQVEFVDRSPTHRVWVKPSVMSVNA